MALPSRGPYKPGERRSGSAREATWTIEWDGHEGLDFDAYDSSVRSPYIQGVGPTTARILWRSNLRKGDANIATPSASLQPGEPFAILVDRGRDSDGDRKKPWYLCYRERDYGINLAWSDMPMAQWELRVPSGAGGVVTAGPTRVALFSRAANDYLVYAQRSHGINLRWRQDVASRPSPYEWVLEGTLPDVSLKNRTAAQQHAPYLVYQARSNDVVNLGWGRSATSNLRLMKLSVSAMVRVAPVGTDLARGTLYTSTSPVPTVHVSEVSWSYVAEKMASHFRDVSSGQSDYWLNSLYERPLIQFEALVSGLQPGKKYHYDVRCDAVHPSRPVTRSSTVSTRTLADDIHFVTAPSKGATDTIRFVTMGDLGPGDSQPSYCYDVFDLLHQVARDRGPHLWLPLGDIDNDTDGHPNAMDPFFFNVYNAYRPAGTPTKTSNVRGKAKTTTVPAFRKGPYHGLLGGLPAYPTFGNHDICTGSNDSKLRYWEMAYRSSFVPPPGWDAASRAFNRAGRGFFYTFRYGDVVFVSLGIPKQSCKPTSGTSWKTHWGNAQKRELERFLGTLQAELSRNSTWLVVYMHDHNYAMGRNTDGHDYSQIFLRHGADLVLAGHHHHYCEFTQRNAGRTRDYRGVLVGTGGFGDDDPGDDARRPGFLFVEIDGNVLQYWKYDTHDVHPGKQCLGVANTKIGKPKGGRSGTNAQYREYFKMEKLGLGRHRQVAKQDLAQPV